MLLKEAEANPDAALAEACQQHAAAWDLLNRADEPAARVALAKLNAVHTAWFAVAVALAWLRWLATISGLRRP